MKTMFERGTALRGVVLLVADRLAWLPPLLARVCVGWVFVESGWGKVTNLPRVIEFFQSLGIPAPELQAPLAAWTELICGALVLIGLFTRVASVPLIVTMVVAILTARKDDLLGTAENPNDLPAKISSLFGMIEFLYIVLLAWLATAGAGCVSIDRLLTRRCPATRRESAASES